MRKGRHEFSKLIVKWTLWGFFAQVILTLVLSFFQMDVAYQMVSLLSVSVPVYTIIFGGYFGKAGIENYNKIKYEATSQNEVG